MADTTDPMVAALLRERAGYLAQGKTDRAALVEEQLRIRGYELPDERKAEPPAEQPPRGRTTRPKQTS